MLSFRQKIFFSYLLVFLALIAALFPFASQTVKQVANRALEDRASEIIEKIRKAADDDELVLLLKEQKATLFFRISVINNEKQVLYDSHVKESIREKKYQGSPVEHPEVLEAFRSGEGSHVAVSSLLGQKLTYRAIAFNFHGKTYVLRIAFPYKYVMEVTDNFEIGFLSLAALVLLLFSLMTWIIIHHLTTPIQQIITAIKPYQEGIESSIPEIRLSTIQANEFTKLAETLNSLSAKVRRHIDTLIFERREKELVLESLNEGIIALDNDLIITYANRMAFQLLGIKEMVGHSIQIIQQELLVRLLNECRKTSKMSTGNLEIKRDGSTLYCDIVAMKMEKRGALLVVQDKTSSHQMIEMRKNFISAASHELKTPITIIMGFAETLHDNPHLPEETMRQITEKMLSNCQRMNNLIKDLLILTDIKKIPERRLIECDLLELIEHCCRTLQELYPKVHITIQKRENQDYLVKIDPNLMQMAIFNLLENGVKYSIPPAQIEIEIDARKEEIHFSISDKGFGIPPNEIENIFLRFYRVEGHPQKIEGSGLGLSIVETAIQKHYGSISVQSAEGEGTQFTVVLPRGI